jgi:light-regulated signal transduction histidine kinase (bacteriophytochrome)
MTNVDCNEIVKTAISGLTDLIEKNEVEITIKPLPIISGHSIELIELFEHLISNAIKFRKKEIPLTILISARSFKGQWLFSMTDNGIGIEDHNKEKAFIIFKRLHNRDEYSGIGIGLAICKKIIELHGGNIWFEPKYEQGTRINFGIPKKEGK